MVPTFFTHVSWLPVDKAEAIPTSLRSTINDRGSLTRRLKIQHNDDFSVRLLSQGRQEPSESERLFLCCQRGEAIVREVLLYGSGRPVVFARTVLPETSLTGQNSELLDLGEKPLGEYIFKQPGLRRGPIEVAAIEAREFNHLLGADFTVETAWARRSLFYLRKKPILVCEVFLPECANASHCATLSAPIRQKSDSAQKNLCQEA